MLCGMANVRPIVVPVDFSPHSEAALLWAANAAGSFGASLLVLHVVHDPAAAPGYYARANETGLVRSMEEIAKQLLDEFVERIRAEHPGHAALDDARVEMVVGLPANRILEVAEREDAPLIVMGSQGRTGLRHLLIGSKALRVVQLSTIPVTIVKAPPESESD
ncbi:MAG: universal stress protein [Planctomycetota bacterium]|nr:universal stress protein [Planctomycetota bacterium]